MTITLMLISNYRCMKETFMQISFIPSFVRGFYLPSFFFNLRFEFVLLFKTNTLPTRLWWLQAGFEYIFFVYLCVVIKASSIDFLRIRPRMLLGITVINEDLIFFPTVFDLIYICAKIWNPGSLSLTLLLY